MLQKSREILQECGWVQGLLYVCFHSKLHCSEFILVPLYTIHEIPREKSIGQIILNKLEN